MDLSSGGEVRTSIHAAGTCRVKRPAISEVIMAL